MQGEEKHKAHGLGRYYNRQWKAMPPRNSGTGPEPTHELAHVENKGADMFMHFDLGSLMFLDCSA